MALIFLRDRIKIEPPWTMTGTKSLSEIPGALAWSSDASSFGEGGALAAGSADGKWLLQERGTSVSQRTEGNNDY